MTISFIPRAAPGRQAMRAPLLPALSALALLAAFLSTAGATGVAAIQDGGPSAVAEKAVVDTGGPEGPVAAMVRRYSEDYGSLDRFYSAPYSPARAERFRRFFLSWQSAVDSLPFDRLGRQDQVDALLFRNTLAYEQKQLGITAARFGEVLPLVPFAPLLTGLEDARRALTPIDPESTAALLDGATASLVATRAKYDSLARGGVSPVGKTTANRAARAVAEIRRTLSGWFTYRDGYDPLFSWWVRAPYARLDSLLGEYAVFVRERLVGVKADDRTTIIGDPIGREALVEELRHEMVPYTPEELVDIAKKEMAWCEAEMLKASRELGCGDDWKKALDHVKDHHMEPGKQPELIAGLAKEAVDFLEARDLITIPPLAKETWRMEMLSPEAQLASPFFLGGEVIQVAFPTDGMGHEQKMMSMRGNNIHFARATVHHELIPGHHLQGFMGQRYRTYRWTFGTPFWTEGWALYWELRLWEMGFAKSPEDRVGMLFWRMHRCARIIFSLSFHLGKMTPAQCIDFLVERVGHERDNATAEVRRSFRGDYGPLYQCAYLLGGLQFRALRRELVESGRMTDRDFHDAVLMNNSMPVEMVRALLTGEGLTRDHQPSWRFYESAGPR
jgi:hypothetical protein